MGKSDLLETATRRRFVLEMRRQGGTYEQIAEAAIEHFGLDRLPKGWDRRYAWMDVERELEKAREQVDEEASHIIEIEVARLDEMLTRIYPVALGNDTVPPDPRAVDRVLKIMDRRAKLLGLDAPSKMEHTGADGERLQGSTIVVQCSGEVPDVE